jgi:hypothetical protein
VVDLVKDVLGLKNAGEAARWMADSLARTVSTAARFQGLAVGHPQNVSRL